MVVILAVPSNARQLRSRQPWPKPIRRRTIRRVSYITLERLGAVSDDPAGELVNTAARSIQLRVQMSFWQAVRGTTARNAIFGIEGKRMHCLQLENSGPGGREPPRGTKPAAARGAR